MRMKLSGMSPLGRPLCGLSSPAVILAAGLAAGCGHTQQYAYPGSYPSSYVGARAVAAVPEKIEMEDDGKPVQAAPRAGIRQTPDDPREPWSRNYGGPSSPPVRRADAEPTPGTSVPMRPGQNADGGGYPQPIPAPGPNAVSAQPVAWVATRG